MKYLFKKASENYLPVIEDIKSNFPEKTFVEFVSNSRQNENRLRTALLVGTVIASGATAMAMGPLSGIGTAFASAALFVNYRAISQVYHKHILPGLAIGASLVSTDLILKLTETGDLGSYGPALALMGHAAISIGAMTLTDEDNPNHQKIRNGIILGMGAIGTVSAFYLSREYGNVSGYIPAVTTAINTYLLGIKSPQTARARVGYLGNNSVLGAYWLSTSPVISAIEALFIHGHISTKLMNDVPMTASPNSDEILPTNERRARYWKEVIWNGKPAEELGKTRAQLGIESPVPSLSQMADSGFRAVGLKPKAP